MTLDHIDAARRKGFRLFGCNNVYQIVPDLEHLYGCNRAWWDEYWPYVKPHPCEKWTTSDAPYPIHHLREVNAPGLSSEPGLIHHGHGSGYSLVNLAYLQGAQRIILLGYDLRYAPDYDGRARRVGGSERHYFGEYPERLRHWPSVRISNGVHLGLLDLYSTVTEVEIINCTPDSALTCFPMMDINAL